MPNCSDITCKSAQLAGQIGQIVPPHLLGKPAHRQGQFPQRARHHLFCCQRAHAAIHRRHRFRILAHAIFWPQGHHISSHFTQP